MSSGFSRAFEMDTPDVTSSERTKNLGAKTVFANMVRTAKTCKGPGLQFLAGENYTGTMKFDISGNVTNYRSYELARVMARGAALKWDNCCLGTVPFTDVRYVGAEAWNANAGFFDWKDWTRACTGGGPQIPPFNGGCPPGTYSSNPLGVKAYVGYVPPVPAPTLCNPSMVPWLYDRLDNAGVGCLNDFTGVPSRNVVPGGTLDGSGVWIDPSNNLFGDRDACVVDKWQKNVLLHVYADLSGNTTKTNYMVAYQPIGGNKNNQKSWSLRFIPPSWNPGDSDCCPPPTGYPPNS